MERKNKTQQQATRTSTARRQKPNNAKVPSSPLKRKSHRAHPINNIAMMLLISVFQILTAFPMIFRNGFLIGTEIQTDDPKLAKEPQLQATLIIIFAVFILVEWAYILIFKTVMHRRNFELEFIAFFLSGIGLVAIGSIDHSAVLVQFITLIAGIILYTIMIFVLGNVELCMKLRTPVAIAAIIFFGINLLLAQTRYGADNWIKIGPLTIQPSEFIKVAFIFVGAATLEKIQTMKNIWKFVAFACVCIGCLFIMKDFGTALIYFFTFLVIAFMQSGDIRTVIFSCTAGLLGAGMIIKFKPHVTARFKGYRHIWEYANESYGYQQTRVLVAMASGGLFGVGIGKGNLRTVAAARNDLIFGVICEEWGFLFGLTIILAFAAILYSALKNSIASRSTFYSIAACAAAGLFLFQTCLHVFGITDLLPLTGVTLPFVSQGGSSMISSWCLLAFIKACDVRTYNYLGGVSEK